LDLYLLWVTFGFKGASLALRRPHRSRLQCGSRWLT
jgi:hypothetical protein